MAKAKKTNCYQQIREAAAKELTWDIRKAIENEGFGSATNLAAAIGVAPNTVLDWIRHPETLNAKKWSMLNDKLHLPAKNFLIAAGFEV